MQSDEMSRFSPKGVAMNERQWELYRRSVAEGMPDSDYKAAVLAGIDHALMRLNSFEAPFNSRSRFDSAAGI